MTFTSLNFIVFLILLVILYYAIPKCRKLVLATGSIYFYYSFGLKNVILLLSMIVLSYLSGGLVKKSQSKKILFGSIILLLIPLLIFKYSGFEIVDAFELVGISFYTFKIISYLVEMSRADLQYSFLDYLIYISFFPTITSGPIDRPKAFIDQLDSAKKFDFEALVGGTMQVLYGYCMKMLLADRLSVIVATIYGNYEQYQGFTLFFASICYTLEIYFDFAGYSHIAIGIAEIFGFKCTTNFLQPYYSRSIKEFWGRWHISLSSWLRDYVYIPLGGNRNGKARKRINLLITFLVSGIWHGAGITFIIWGGIHGICLVVEDAFREKVTWLKGKCNPFFLQIWDVVSLIWTFLVVNFAWIFFYCNSAKMAFDVIKRIFTGSSGMSQCLDLISFSNTEKNIIIFALVFFGVIDYLAYKGVDIKEYFVKKSVIIRAIVIYTMLFLVIFAGAYGSGYEAASFIYFQF